jgi:CheY-like chemotaxis protein
LLAIRANLSQAVQRFNETPAGDQDLEGLRVVLVEDDPDTLALLAVILEGAGAEVRSCVNADEAVETVERWQPHLLLSDIGLPGKDGYALIQELFRNDASLAKKMVAVALTAYASSADRQRALSCGFHAHVAKPIDALELVGVVRRLTARIRQQRP